MVTSRVAALIIFQTVILLSTTMFRSTIVAALVATVAAGVIDPQAISADSKFGRSLLSKAEVIEPVRHLEQNGDYSYLYKYDIKYVGCSSLVQINGEGNAEEGALYTQHLVKFSLCPSGSCSSCSNGGMYAVNMMQFVQAYSEYKEEEKEYKCQMIENNCYCDNANDDQACLASCYQKQGMSECIEYEGQEEFKMEEYMECRGKCNTCFDGGIGLLPGKVYSSPFFRFPLA